MTDADKDLLDKLKTFAKAMFEISEWPYGGDIDGFAFQDAALEAGLLTAEIRTRLCGDDCACGEYHNPRPGESWTCYHKAAWLDEVKP